MVESLETFKKKMVLRMSGPRAVSATSLSRATLHRWPKPSGPSAAEPPDLFVSFVISRSTPISTPRKIPVQNFRVQLTHRGAIAHGSSLLASHPTMDIRLVRTEGKTYEDLYCFDPKQLYLEAPLRVESRDSIAREAEARLGLGDCLYFYAGHACPDFGNIVLVYRPELVLDDDDGSASDYDTGGLYRRRVHFAPPLSEDECIEWGRARLWSLQEWRSRCEMFVKNHFDDWAPYVTGQRANNPDDEGRMSHPDNERRAWTVEVRIHRDHHVLQHLAHVGLDHTGIKLVQQFIRLEPDRSKKQRWRRYLQTGVVKGYNRLELHAAVEERIAAGEV